MRTLIFMLASCVCFQAVAFAGDEPTAPAEYTHRLQGLFSSHRDGDLRELFKQIPEIEIVSIDMKNGEATFKYDEQKVFGKGTKEQIVQRFDMKLQQMTRGTFRVLARVETPADRLMEVEIQVLGLDCPACCYAAAQIVFEKPGVKQARASFKDGILTALVEQEKFNRTEAEEALKQQGVLIKTP